jgi:hypothetical protein
MQSDTGPAFQKHLLSILVVHLFMAANDYFSQRMALLFCLSCFPVLSEIVPE